MDDNPSTWMPCAAFLASHAYLNTGEPSPSSGIPTGAAHIGEAATARLPDAVLDLDHESSDVGMRPVQDRSCADPPETAANRTGAAVDAVAR